MASGRGREKIVISPPCDIISDLPVNVIETILMCLPLRDAVRTSILSKRWRNNWVRIPHLVFDDTFCRALEKNQPYSKNKLMMTIYHVLLLHCGPILKFTLSVSKLESCPEIDLLIKLLSRSSSVEEITLRVRRWYNSRRHELDERYKLPSSLFSCLQLRILNLCFCIFKPPHVFNGFSKLTRLIFNDVDFDVDLFGNFVSGCPLLEELSLKNSMSFDCLEIDAPKLKYLYIDTSFNSIHLKNSPLLEVLSITSAVIEHLEHLKKGETSNVIEVFASLPVIGNLYLGYRYIKFLSLGGVPVKLPFTLNHLKVLNLYHQCFGLRDEVSVVLCLIKSSPNLEYIVIEVFVSTTAVEGPVLELFQVQDYSDFTLNRLREVHISLFSGSRPELEFIKLILANSSMLEKMNIEPNLLETGKELRMLKELLRFRRASPKAEITYEDSAEDQV